MVIYLRDDWQGWELGMVGGLRWVIFSMWWFMVHVLRCCFFLGIITVCEMKWCNSCQYCIFAHARFQYMCQFKAPNHVVIQCNHPLNSHITHQELLLTLLCLNIRNQFSLVFFLMFGVVSVFFHSRWYVMHFHVVHVCFWRLWFCLVRWHGR